MSTYTKHHRKYLETHKDQINAHRRKRYFNKQYGIPIDRYEYFIGIFKENRVNYIRFCKLIATLHQMTEKLNPDLVQLLMDHSCSAK